MMLYDYRCESGHRFEAGVASMSSPAPHCPDCGECATRVLSRVSLGGQASAGVARSQMPNSWTGVAGGHPDAVGHWRRAMTRREKLEEKYPELGGDRRPVLAHEGIFRSKPLRAGDDIPSSVAAAAAEAGAAQASSKTSG